MSTTIYLHGPHKFKANLTGEEGAPGSFASLETGDASLFLYTRADCDALIRAALAARDLLPEPCTCADEAGPTACVPCGGPAPDLDLVLSRACRDGGHAACVNDNDSPQCAYPCECSCHAAACASCGAAGDLLAVHDTGGDGTVSYYCANTGACGRRRQKAAKAAVAR